MILDSNIKKNIQKTHQQQNQVRVQHNQVHVQHNQEQIG